MVLHLFPDAFPAQSTSVMQPWHAPVPVLQTGWVAVTLQSLFMVHGPQAPVPRHLGSFTLMLLHCAFVVQPVHASLTQTGAVPEHSEELVQATHWPVPVSQCDPYGLIVQSASCAHTVQLWVMALQAGMAMGQFMSLRH
jgi:hypothetical protein